MTALKSERKRDRGSKSRKGFPEILIKVKWIKQEWVHSPLLVVLVGWINPSGVLPDTFVSLGCGQRPGAANQRLRYCTHAVSAESVCMTVVVKSMFAGQCVSRHCMSVCSGATCCSGASHTTAVQTEAVQSQPYWLLKGTAPNRPGNFNFFFSFHNNYLWKAKTDLIPM